MILLSQCPDCLVYRCCATTPALSIFESLQTLRNTTRTHVILPVPHQNLVMGYPPLVPGDRYGKWDSIPVQFLLWANHRGKAMVKTKDALHWGSGIFISAQVAPLPDLSFLASGSLGAGDDPEAQGCFSLLRASPDSKLLFLSGILPWRDLFSG